MCGPTDAQTKLQDSQTAFYTQLQQQDAQQYSEDQGILTQMQSVYAPILAAGPNQYGFSDAETQDLNSEAKEGVAQNYANANRSLKENQAAQGGGNSFLPSGVASQQQEELDSAAARTSAGEGLQIKQAGYDQGYKNFAAATGALEGTAGLLNPSGAASVANSAGSDASSTASDIAKENESWMAPLAGAAGAIGAAAVSKIP